MIDYKASVELQPMPHSSGDMLQVTYSVDHRGMRYTRQHAFSLVNVGDTLSLPRVLRYLAEELVRYIEQKECVQERARDVIDSMPFTELEMKPQAKAVDDGMCSVCGHPKNSGPCQTQHP